jgi:hypothetical protein
MRDLKFSRQWFSPVWYMTAYTSWIFTRLQHVTSHKTESWSPPSEHQIAWSFGIQIVGFFPKFPKCYFPTLYFSMMPRITSSCLIWPDPSSWILRLFWRNSFLSSLFVLLRPSSTSNIRVCVRVHARLLFWKISLRFVLSVLVFKDYVLVLPMFRRALQISVWIKRKSKSLYMWRSVSRLVVEPVCDFMIMSDGWPSQPHSSRSMLSDRRTGVPFTKVPVFFSCSYEHTTDPRFTHMHYRPL